RPSLRQNLDFAAGSFDLGYGRPAERVGPHLEGAAQLAVAQNFHLAVPTLKKAPLAQALRGDRRAVFKALGQSGHVDDGVLLPEAVVEPPLGHPPHQGRLPTLEPRLLGAARAGTLALLTPARGLAVTRPRSPADPLRPPAGPGMGFQLVQPHARPLLTAALKPAPPGPGDSPWPPCPGWRAYPHAPP